MRAACCLFFVVAAATAAASDFRFDPVHTQIFFSIGHQGYSQSTGRFAIRDGFFTFDNDDWSIENAKENIAENHCAKIKVLKLDAPPQNQAFDVILANINKQVLIREIALLGQQLKQEGVILLSGLLHEDFEDIENQALKNNLSVSVRTTEGSWICLKMEKSPN